MRCIRCNKPVTRYAKTIAGPVAYGAQTALGWGPKCARLAFGGKARPRKTTARSRLGGHADLAQIDWIEQAAA